MEIRRRIPAVLAFVSIPLAACVIAAIALGDWRYVGVALMFLFVVCPGVLALGWFSLATAPGISRRLSPQIWRFNPDGIIITFYTFPRGDGEEDRPDGEADILFSELCRFEIIGDFAYFFTRVPTFGTSGEYYIIPVSLLPAGLAQRLTDQLYDQQQ